MKTRTNFFGSVSSVALPLLIWMTPGSTLQGGNEEISRARAFEEPLVPIGGHATVKENKALGTALAAYVKRDESDDASPITNFLQRHPASVWRASLLTNLGLAYRRTAHFSKALGAWEEAWKLAKNESDVKARAVGDRAVGELADLTARLGHQEKLENVLEQVSGRDVRGPATERLSAARQALWQMRQEPEDSFRCGPYALSKVSEANRPGNARTTEILRAPVTPQGMSLRQLNALAEDFQLKLRMAKREAGAAVPVPSVVHWRLGHYGALVKEQDGRYLLQDPTLSTAPAGEAWISRAALDAEASGYFLIPEGGLPEGWHSVSGQEGDTVWGSGYTSGSNPNGTGPYDPRGGGGNCGPGMAAYSVHLMLVSLHIEDTPVGYTPPRGPDMHFKVSYNQREANQPATFSYSNFGAKWTSDWLSYVIDDPQSPSRDVDLYNRGGGTETYTGFDTATRSYAPQYLNGAVLRRIAPAGYERRLSDGSYEIFNRSDGSASFPRKVFMTRLIDPYGNAADLSYDADLRLTTVIDPLGQPTTLSYELPGDTLKITRVTDPFGRFATFEYNDSGQLVRITDVIGLQSQFDYDTGDFIRAMTTPYGTTTFAKGEQGTTRFLEATDPLGDTERVEYRQQAPGVADHDDNTIVPQFAESNLLYNSYLDGRDTFYWDKKTWRDFPGDYTKAKMFHFLHENAATTGRVIESIKEPLERRVWFLYPGMTTRGFIDGVRLAQPSRIARVLDDGTTQLYQFEYNRRGKVNRSVDPIGRALSSDYAFNGLDLLEVAQTRAPNPDLLASFTYNAQHLPLTATDAAQQTTTMTYNGFGQVRTITNPKNETKTFTYDDKGYLMSVEGPLPGSITRLTYDDFGRVQTVTDSAGYTLTFDYDPLDRLVQIGYPDGTSRSIVYNRLDPEQLIDRLGRPTIRTYNERRQLIRVQDPAQRITQFEWCPCGRLQRVIDPLNRPTTWNYDVQRRVTSKVFPDGTALEYTYENTTSRLQQVVDAKGQARQYQYYLDNTLKQISYAGGGVPTPSISFTYDPNYGRVLTMDDGTGRTTYEYNPITKGPGIGAGKLESETGPLPNSTITYQYDELGRVIERAVNGVAQTRIYDALGRVALVTNPLGDFALNYVDATNRLSSIDYPNGQRTAFAYYDVLGDLRLQEIQNLDPASAVLSRFNYGYDAEGRIMSWTRQADGGGPIPYTLGYDGADQLLSAVPQGIGSQYTYTYDDAGNRLTEQIDGDVTNASYNELNQLIGRVVPTLPDPDSVVRLSEVTYDGLGRRVRIVEREGGVVVSDKRFVWCGRELCEERDGSGATVVKRFYPYGVQVNGESFFYARDHLRSIREMTDATGAVRASYDYDPYGRPTKVGGDLDADLGFAGLDVHSASGLQLALYRGYDANLGRWVSRDPIAEFGGLNLYAYANNDPINFVDPTGLVPQLPCDICNPPPPPPPAPNPLAPPPLSCPMCRPQPSKPLPCASGSPPYLPDTSGGGSGDSGPGGSGGGGSGDSPFGPPPPDPAGGPVGPHRADPPNFGGPPNGDPPQPTGSFHFNFDTDPPGVKGAGGNVGSIGPDVDFDKVKDAARILNNLVNQLSD